MKANSSPFGKLSDQDLRLLRIFKSVADSGGFSQAELSLNLALSTISRHVKDLETRLGLVLCRRGRSGFELTPEGSEVYRAAVQLLDATDTFRDTIRGIHKNLGGELNIALFEKTVSNPQSRLPAALGRFHQTAPDVCIHLHTGTITSIERGILNGDYHLGVIPQHRDSDTLAYDYLFGEQMLLYAGRQHPWFQPDARPKWQDLHNQHLAGLDYHSPNANLLSNHQLHKTMPASDEEAVATLILSGICVGFLPDHYAEAFVRSGQMRPVHPELLNYHCRFFAITRKTGEPDRMTQLMLEQLRAAYGNHNDDH